MVPVTHGPPGVQQREETERNQSALITRVEWSWHGDFGWVKGLERIRIPMSLTQAAGKFLRGSCTLGVANLKCSEAQFCFAFFFVCWSRKSMDDLGSPCESPSRDGTQRPVARQLSNYKIHADQQVREVPLGRSPTLQLQGPRLHQDL